MRSLSSHRGCGAAVCALFALCVVQGAASASSAADPAEQPVSRLTKADNARARSAALRQVDVFENFEPDSSLRSAPVISHCAYYPGDRSDVTVTGSARSAFKSGSNSIGSTVLWFKTKADADRYWKKTVRQQYVQCLAANLSFTFENGETVKPRIALAAAIGVKPTGAERAIAYRVIGQVTGDPVTEREPFNWIETAVFVKTGRGIGLLRTIWINHVCDCHHELGRTLARRINHAK